MLNKAMCRRPRELYADECGGCGIRGVTDNCCTVCAQGYPMPTEQEMKDADEYYRNHVQPPEKPKELFALTKSQQEVVDFINQDGKTK